MGVRMWAWGLGGAVIVALASYVFWPVSAQDSHRVLRHWPEDAILRLQRDDLHQELADGRLLVNGLSRPLAAEAVDTVRRRWLALRWQERIEGLAADELPAYGIDGRRRLELSGQLWQWGQRRDVTWVHDGHDNVLYAVGDAGLARVLDRVAGRLDRPVLITAGLQGRVAVNDRAVVWSRGAGWRAEEAVWKPAFDGRVARLDDLLRDIHLSDLTGVEVPAEASTKLRIALGPSADPAAHIVFSGQDGIVWVAVDDLPAQVLEASLWQDLKDVAEAWAEDRLFDIAVPFVEQPLRTIIVERGGAHVLSLEFNDLLDHDDIRSRWNVLWSGGMAQGDEALGERWLAALNNIPLRSVVADEALRDPPDSDHPQAVTLRLSGLRMDDTWLHIDGDVVTAPGYRGQAERIPDLLTGAVLADCLDPHLLRVEPERIEILQRVEVVDEGQRTATVLRQVDGLWQQVAVVEQEGERQRQPPVAVDPLVVERLHRVLLRSPVRPLGMADAADRSIGALPGDRQVRVGIAALEQIDSLDRARLEDTLPRTWAIALRRVAEDDAWRGVVEDQDLVYQLDDELVEELFAASDRPLVLPILPAHIQSVTVYDPPRDESGYRLRRHGDEWQLEIEGRREAADGRAVRRWLRALTNLEYAAHDSGAPVVGRDAQRATAFITVQVAGIEAAGETFSLAIDRPEEPDDPVAVTLSASSPRAQVRAGQLLVPRAALEELLVPAGHLRPWEEP